MFIVYLEFSNNKSQAGAYMEAHKAWIQQGLQDGVFLAVGSLQPNRGGAVIATNTSESSLRQRIEQDPFVEHDVVTAVITEITVHQTDERLKFLLV